MNSNQETLQKITRYEPLLLGLFCLLLTAKIIRIPYLEIPISIFTYAILALYVFKLIVHKGELNRAENLIRNAYLLLIILGLLSLVMHVQHWYHFRWGIRIFLIGIPLVGIISFVKKIEFKGVFSAPDVFLATTTYCVLVPIFFHVY